MRRTLSWSTSQDSTPGILHWILALITSYGPKWSQYRLKWAKPKQSPTIRNKRCALRFFAAKFYEIQCKTRLIWMKCQPTSYDWKNPYFHLFSGCMFWDEMFSPCLQLSISKATFSEAPLKSDCVSKNSGEPTILHNSNVHLLLFGNRTSDQDLQKIQGSIAWTCIRPSSTMAWIRCLGREMGCVPRVFFGISNHEFSLG